MNYKIGIFGSSAEVGDSNIEKCQKLGEYLAQKECILITGACEGLPFEAVKSAHSNNGITWGFPEFSDINTFIKTTKHDTSMYTKLFFIPKDFEFLQNRNISRKYRNVSSTTHTDAGIIVSGRWGSLNEFTNLYDMGKVIGVLTETGGIADELKSLTKKIKKPSLAKVFFNSDPKSLIDSIYKELDNRNS